ncbi:MAG: Flp family type IVb pilin [Acidimicrobiia bacterium]
MMNRVTSLPTQIYAAFQTFRASERGASMVEYVLMVALIAMVAFVAVALAGTALNEEYDSIASSVERAGSGS